LVDSQDGNSRLAARSGGTLEGVAASGSAQSDALFRFLDQLGQAVARSTDADDIMAMTTRLTALHLGLSNCAYADMDEDEDGFTIRGNWHAPGSPSIVGHYSLADFGRLAVQELSAGRPLIINDNLKEIAPEEAKTFQDIGIAATICMPLVKGGRLIALMAIHDKEPHFWSDYELAVIREVTERCWAHVERVRADAELRASHQRFAAAISATEGVLWTGDRHGRMTGEQEAWSALTGQTREQYQGEGWAAAIHPDDVQATVEAWNAAVAARETYAFEHRVRRFDGEWRLFSTRAIPIVDAQGEVCEWVGVHTDVTETRALEEALEQRVEERTAELQRANEALRHAQKMEAIGQLTGGIAHDFNNLLTPIVGALDVLKSKDLDPRSLRLVEGALTSAERSRTLIARLLSFARRQRLESRDISARRLLSGLTDLITRSVDPTIRIDIRPTDPAVVVRVDPNQLELALLNLIVNARDAMPGGGTIVIGAAADELGPDNAALVAPGSYVRFTVEDQGEGMDEATLSHAIEPFFSTKGQGRGTGLGLSMVHGLAIQSGGGLAIRSEVDRGTTVDLWLPAGSAAEIEDEPEEPSMAEIRPLRILLVDDEHLVRSATADMLADAGHMVDQADSGGSALQQFERDCAYDVIITDYAMPMMSGAALIRKLRAVSPDVPALLITGYASATVDVPADVPRIAKPFRSAELLRRLDEVTPPQTRGKSATSS
jgi:PAS domain S-box-containing protein